MAEVFDLPAVGDTMVDAEIVEWFVAVGDEVALDQPICSIETDKSVVEMITPYRGRVLALGGEAGDVIAVGEPLILVGAPGEEPATPSVDAEPARVPDVGPVQAEAPPGPVTTAELGSVRAMPKVRKLARERSVDLATVTGTGPHGSITTADIDAAAAARSGSRERLSPLRRSIARHLTESIRQIPQFTSMVEVDATAVLATRAALAQRIGSAVPFDAVLMAVLVPVLADHPVMNAMLDSEPGSDEIVYFDHYHIGVAVDTADGLMVPVVRDADRRSVSELSAEILRLAGAARARTIEPHELSGATTTLNNVGSLGIVAGTPILPVGTGMIVAFGKARALVQLRDGNPVEVPTLTVCGTFDHRIIDGGSSGRFLAQLKDHIEVPDLDGRT